MVLNSILIAIVVYLGIDMLLGIYYKKSSVFNRRVRNISNLNKNNLGNEDILDLSFQERIIKPLIDGMIKTVAVMVPIQEKTQKELEERLAMAGLNIKAKDYRATNIVVMSLLFIIGFGLGLATKNSVLLGISYGLLGLFSGYTLRRFALESKITERKKDIKRQLPDIMDILSVSVVAGLSFDQALVHVVDSSKGPLIDEFFITQREMSLGKSKKDSLNDMIKRCQVDEVTSFLGAIIQADEMGISLQSVLNAQSKMIREAYRQDIEERAGKIPVKILLPMVLFIFPVIFIIILSPAVPKIMEGLGGIQ